MSKEFQLRQELKELKALPLEEQVGPVKARISRIQKQLKDGIVGVTLSDSEMNFIYSCFFNHFKTLCHPRQIEAHHMAHDLYEEFKNKRFTEEMLQAITVYLPNLPKKGNPPPFFTDYPPHTKMITLTRRIKEVLTTGNYT